MDKIAVLENSIQEYAWGSKSFIPEMIGESSPAKNPKAEMWIGSHSNAPSMAVYGDNRISLAELINRNPAGILGASTAKKFANELPFLFKVLAAEKPLSIQAHPEKGQAMKGFIRENMNKIPMDSPERNYRDENHKPELICALEPLCALKGFREIEDILEILGELGTLTEGIGIDILRNQPNEEGIKKFFVSLMNLEGDKKQKLIDDIVGRIKGFRSLSSTFDWIVRLNVEYPSDMGALSPLFLNVVQLWPREAMYIPSGELHAYLKGAGLELMANSDNVIRGGLTSKHVDLTELLSILNFTPRVPDILRPEVSDGSEAFYPATAEEFMLSVISLDNKDSIYTSPLSRSAEIMICTEGEAHITDLGKGDILKVHRGVTLFIPAAVKQYLIQGGATIYKASVPI